MFEGDFTDISAGVDGVLSGVLRMCIHKREDPHRRKYKFLMNFIRHQLKMYLPDIEEFYKCALSAQWLLKFSTKKKIRS